MYTVSKATAGLPQGSVWLLCSLIGAVLPELLHQTMSAEEMEVRDNPAQPPPGTQALAALSPDALAKTFFQMTWLWLAADGSAGLLSVDVSAVLWCSVGASALAASAAESGGRCCRFRANPVDPKDLPSKPARTDCVAGGSATYTVCPNER